jgi:uncharacterized protein
VTTNVPASDRVRLRRLAGRAAYDRQSVLEVLDAGFIAHVGVVAEDGPVVVPMAYGRSEDWLYLHGSAANAALRAATGQDVCVTVTLVDGIVIGRSPFHNSMNYRSVVVRGVARQVDDPAEREAALRLVSDHVVATWDSGRPPTDRELRTTLVVAVPLVEMSAKTRAGDPIDEPSDDGGPHWAGYVPIRSVWSRPVSAADLPPGVEVPAAIAALGGQPVHGGPATPSGQGSPAGGRSQTVQRSSRR